MRAYNWFTYCIRFGATCCMALVFGAYLAWQQISSKPVNTNGKEITLIVKPGTSLQRLTQQLEQAKIISNPTALCWYGMANGFANNLKAGEYLIKPGSKLTAVDILKNVVNGKVAQYAFTIIEGWHSNDVIAALQKNPKINATLSGLTSEQIIAKLDLPVTNLEGMFSADTYYFTAQTSDVAFLRRAYFNMQKKLLQAWEQRSKNTILKDPYEALILASIIEKESALHDEYPEISGVYQRRLAKNMRLQADPTVIYGMGNGFNGMLYKSNLKLDTPYNTYTRNGLPPTPIAIPSMQALYAALHPQEGDTLYFVANGQGGHVFSKSLPEHNKAVANKL